MPFKLNKQSLILLSILLLATTIRAYRISDYPSLNPDEAALGYNAYSLLQTGKDEHGISWPLHFKSFGDYKPGGYIYLALPFIKILGLNPLAVRLPNLIFSILTIFVLYKLAYLLTSNFKLSSLTVFVLTVSPWHIHFSRGAWESSTSVFFIITGLYFLYRFILQKNQRTLVIAALFFALSFYIYHSARIITPILILAIIVFEHKIFFDKPRQLFVPILIGLLITIPVFFSLIRSGGNSRFNGVGIFSDSGPHARSEELLNQHGHNSLYDRTIHNYRLLYGISFLQKYSSHFDLNYLFTNGDEVPRSKVPDMGQLHLIELPLLLLGIIFTIKSSVFTVRTKRIIFSLLIISPLASSLTFQAPSALRSLAMVIPLSILISTGTYHLLSLFPKPIFVIILSVLYLFSFIYYLDAYFIHYEKRYPFAWNTGFSEIIPFVDLNKTKYQNIFFTDKYDQPYILYLFFSKYPPPLLQPQIKLTPPDKFGFSTVAKIDNINFGIPDDIPPNSLVINSSDFSKTGKSFKIEVK